MAHFAKIDKDGTVLDILVVPNEQEQRGQEFLSKDLGLGGNWIQTSYNTRGGVHFDSKTQKPSLDQSKSLRKNYATIGGTYDKKRDAFIAPKPVEENCIFDEDSCLWIIVDNEEN